MYVIISLDMVAGMEYKKSNFFLRELVSLKSEIHESHTFTTHKGNLLLNKQSASFTEIKQNGITLTELKNKLFKSLRNSA